MLIKEHVGAMRPDVLVCGGGMGGVAASLAALRHGCSVVLVESGVWLGGQLTQQVVPPDDHPWIERHGCSSSYRTLRQGIRDYYRRWYPLNSSARRKAHLNPGDGLASPLAHEPCVALAVINAMLAPYRSCGQLTVLLRHKIVSIDVQHDQIVTVIIQSGADGKQYEINPRYVIDATETGELLPLAGAEYVTGAESQDETGEPHAPQHGNPASVQACTVGFVIEHRTGEDHTISKPTDYDYWCNHQPALWTGSQLSWVTPHPRTLEPITHGFSPNPPASDSPVRLEAEAGDEEGWFGKRVLAQKNLWLARRILSRHNFTPDTYTSDIVIVNWLMNDYFGGSVYEIDGFVNAESARQNTAAARELSRSLLYWMQTEAPRSDGGLGYPGLRPRGDITGTSDGLSMAPYIRESRRLRALTTITERDVSVDIRGTHGAASYVDSVGVGCWWIDLHPSTTGDSFLHLPTYPFEIPLGALIPQRLNNLLAGAKNIGATHLTNGCYRVHPVEWATGEASGVTAAYSARHELAVQAVQQKPEHRDEMIRWLERDGVERHWPHELRTVAIG